jgi:hypothetical protein
MKINEFITEGKKKVEVSTKKPIGYEISDVGKGGVEKNKRSDAEWKKQKGEDLEEGVFGNMAAAAKGAMATKGQGGVMKTIGKAIGNAKNAWTNNANTAGMKAAQKAQAQKVEAGTQKAMNSWARSMALVPQGQAPTQATLNAWWQKQFGTTAPRINVADNAAVAGAVRKAVQQKLAAAWSGSSAAPTAAAPAPQPSPQVPPAAPQPSPQVPPAAPQPVATADLGQIAAQIKGLSQPEQQQLFNMVFATPRRP